MDIDLAHPRRPLSSPRPADLQARYEEIAPRVTELDAIVAIHSGSLRKKRSEFDDQYWPLRPVPHFQHWAPLAQPDCALIVTPGKPKPTLAWLKAFDFWEYAFLRAPRDVDHFLGSFEVVEMDRVEQVKELLQGKPRRRSSGEDTVARGAVGDRRSET